MDGMNLTFKDSTFDYIYTNPPFLGEEKYSGLPEDITTPNIDEYKKRMVKMFKENYRVLKPNSLFTLTLNDERRSYLIPLQRYAIEWAENVGFRLWDFVVAEVRSQRLRFRKKDYELKRTAKCHEYVITFIKGNIK